MELWRIIFLIKLYYCIDLFFIKRLKRLNSRKFGETILKRLTIRESAYFVSCKNVKGTIISRDAADNRSKHRTPGTTRHVPIGFQGNNLLWLHWNINVENAEGLFDLFSTVIWRYNEEINLLRQWENCNLFQKNKDSKESVVRMPHRESDWNRERDRERGHECVRWIEYLLKTTFEPNGLFQTFNGTLVRVSSDRNASRHPH